MAEPVGAPGAPTRLPGSGVVPRAFALAAFVIVTAFQTWWLVTDPAALTNPILYLVELLVAALLVRSLFLGVHLDGDAVLVRTWFRAFRYGPGELRAVVTVPYWKFLDRDDPILSLLKFTPEAGWVRELSGTVAWRDKAAAHAAAIRRHLAIEEDA